MRPQPSSLLLRLQLKARRLKTHPWEVFPSPRRRLHNRTSSYLTGFSARTLLETLKRWEIVALIYLENVREISYNYRKYAWRWIYCAAAKSAIYVRSIWSVVKDNQNYWQVTEIRSKGFKLSKVGYGGKKIWQKWSNVLK